ncbi:hypothetical protein HOLleu_22752 [Holothuria leucospilota]|uniref:Uncharacterized protein n=1 Tax=Holothuria leucospilota TaxID=206669 RepID=A0A9Q1H4U2_HOLLE|nr:hypothetical protein HOLleu_22752 [Holothuria leucospilota]
MKFHCFTMMSISLCVFFFFFLNLHPVLSLNCKHVHTMSPKDWMFKAFTYHVFQHLEDNKLLLAVHGLTYGGKCQ